MINSLCFLRSVKTIFPLIYKVFKLLVVKDFVSNFANGKYPFSVRNHQDFISFLAFKRADFCLLYFG